VCVCVKCVVHLYIPRLQACESTHAQRTANASFIHPSVLVVWRMYVSIVLHTAFQMRPKTVAITAKYSCLELSTITFPLNYASCFLAVTTVVATSKTTYSNLIVPWPLRLCTSPSNRPYCFRIHGQIFHRSGDLHLSQGVALHMVSCVILRVTKLYMLAWIKGKTLNAVQK
jgi:hypothetical protein